MPRRSPNNSTPFITARTPSLPSLGPRRVNDGRFVKRLLAYGGYPAWSECSDERGQPALSTPLYFPAQQEA